MVLNFYISLLKKGAGLDAAEEDRIEFHAIGKINAIKSSSVSGPKYQDIFGDWIVDMASKDKELVAITPAMREGSGLVKFSRKFPDRYFDVAIAEQHSVTFAAGLALEGKKTSSGNIFNVSSASIRSTYS